MEYQEVISALATRYNIGSVEKPAGDTVDAGDHNYQNEAIRAVVEHIGIDGANGDYDTIAENLAAIWQAILDLGGTIDPNWQGEVEALRFLTYGQRSDYTRPAGTVDVAATTYADLMTEIAGADAGTHFWITDYYRPTMADLVASTQTENGASVDRNFVPRFSPIAGHEFHFAPGAAIDGRVVLTGWVDNGDGTWHVTGQTQRLRRQDDPDPGNDPGNPGYPYANYAEQVWFNGAWLEQVGNLADLVPGTFFFGYGDAAEPTADMQNVAYQDRIYIADDPTGATVETTITDGCLRDFSASFSVYNGKIVGHGNPFQTGAVEGSAVRLENTEVSHNSGGAAILNNSSIMTGCRFNYNGQAGPGAGGGAGMCTDTEIAYNNQKHGNSLWWSHACKPTRTTGWVYRRVWCHDNDSSGLVSDVSNREITWDLCLVEDNAGHGIVHELGYSATIQHCIVRGNGWGAWTTFEGHRGGIIVVNSQSVTVEDNIVELYTGAGAVGIMLVQDNRQVDASNNGPEGPWVLQNNTVTGNAVSRASDAVGVTYLAGFDLHGDIDEVNPRANYVDGTLSNDFTANAYDAPTAPTSGTYFFYPDLTYVADPDNLPTPLTFAQWQAEGYDVDGSIE